jgi:hypothetical protein
MCHFTLDLTASATTIPSRRGPQPISHIHFRRRQFSNEWYSMGSTLQPILVAPTPGYDEYSSRGDILAAIILPAAESFSPKQVNFNDT